MSRSADNIHYKKANNITLSPIIATIVLIGATLVLALAVGSYSLNVFGNSPRQIQLGSATTIYGGSFSSSSSQGTAELVLYLQNPGEQTNISSIMIDGGGLSTPPSPVVCSSPTSCVPMGEPSVQTGSVQFSSPTTAFYFESPASGNITTGGTYSFTLVFANGQSITGSLIAQ